MMEKKQNKDFLFNTSYRSEGKKVKTFNEYGKDKTGKITYHFNKYGYRGEDFNPDAKKLIYIGGCSHTFGTGIEWEETFPYVFKKYYAKKHGLKIDDVNLMNFSIGAASNAYIVRTLISQCNVVKPDVLICNFAHKKNLEFKTLKGNLGYCPSVPDLRRRFMKIFNNPFFDDTNLFVETLKNMLLLQYYCQLNKIKYVFSWVDVQYLYDNIDKIIDTHRFLKEEIDLRHFVNRSIRDKEVKIDLAADKEQYGDRAHAGPKSHEKYGKMFFDKYQELYEK